MQVKFKALIAALSEQLKESYWKKGQGDITSIWLGEISVRPVGLGTSIDQAYKIATELTEYNKLNITGPHCEKESK